MGGTLYKYGDVILDIHSSATMELNADLHLGYNLRKNSNAETYLKLHEGSNLIVNGNFNVFFGASIEVFSGGTLTLNSGYINSGSHIACAESIAIGAGAAIARGVYIYDSDHHKLLQNGEQTNLNAAIIIEPHVWVGVSAVILKGVTIGTGAIIAAGAVVTHNVPARCLVVGNPARVTKENVEWR